MVGGDDGLVEVGDRVGAGDGVERREGEGGLGREGEAGHQHGLVLVLVLVLTRGALEEVVGNGAEGLQGPLVVSQCWC